MNEISLDLLFINVESKGGTNERRSAGITQNTESGERVQL